MKGEATTWPFEGGRFVESVERGPFELGALEQGHGNLQELLTPAQGLRSASGGSLASISDQAWVWWRASASIAADSALRFVLVNTWVRSLIFVPARLADANAPECPEVGLQTQMTAATRLGLRFACCCSSAALRQSWLHRPDMKRMQTSPS